MRKANFKKGRSKLITALTIMAFFVQVSSTLAKEKKHGAELVIVTRDGTVIKGELLAVKKTKLIMMGSETMSEVNRDISEIRSVKVVKKSNFLKGLGYGLLIGAGSGALLGLASGNDEPGWFSWTAGEKAKVGAIAFGIIGTPLGGIWGAIKGIDESIDLEGRSPEEIKLILKKLNEKSRFPQKQPENLGDHF